MSECDNLEKPVFDEPWVHHAVPGSTVNEIFHPEQCLRFTFEATSNTSTTECPAEWFSEKQVACNEWVFDPKERTIVNDVNMRYMIPSLSIFIIAFSSGKLHALRICGC